MRIRTCEVVTLILALICMIASIVTWIIFPIIYPKMVKENLYFAPTNDEGLGLSAFLMANPPMHNVMKFYFFNVSNTDQMLYYGEKPRVIETGAYAVRETEHKKYLEFSKDGNEVFYENYKIYQIAEDLSCDTCSFDDLVTIPNPTEVGAAADIMDPKYGMSKTAQAVISYGLLLVGEYPFITHTVREILFDGYNDAMLSFVHSPLMQMLNGIFKGGKPIIPIPIPAMEKMGFFIGYNNSRDESYWIKTGKDDIEQLGKIVKWGGVEELPEYWWPTKYSRSIRGSDSGSFAKWHLKKEDKLEMFQSFQCRSFNKLFLEETTVHGIPCYAYSTPYEDYDTTLEVNKGFRYGNLEQVNYFPEWPACPEKDPSKCDPTETVDCSMREFFCHNCCNGSFVDGTYLLPPGIFPLVCYPGRLQPTPFFVMYSPPHYLYSPQEMVDSIVGLAPDADKHRPMVYDHEPNSGQVTRVQYQLQVSTPIMSKTSAPGNMHLPNAIIPLFWQGAHATLTDATYHKIWLGFVFVPKIVNFVKYALVTFGLFLIVLLVLIRVRRSRSNERNSIEITKDIE